MKKYKKQKIKTKRLTLQWGAISINEFTWVNSINFHRRREYFCKIWNWEIFEDTEGLALKYVPQVTLFGKINTAEKEHDSTDELSKNTRHFLFKQKHYKKFTTWKATRSLGRRTKINFSCSTWEITTTH